MPIYEYKCPRCGAFETMQSVNASPLKRCPRCRSRVHKLISASSFRLKGGGWYADGYQKRKASSASSEKKAGKQTQSKGKAAGGSSGSAGN